MDAEIVVVAAIHVDELEFLEFAPLLVEFLFRLTFGVAVAMALTPSQWVTSGFYRVHLWVLMGIQTLVALATYSGNYVQFWLAVMAAIASYVGAVIWMYDRRLAGKVAILFVAACSLAGSLLPVITVSSLPQFLHVADRLTSGLVLGLVTTAMLLGHWYLNTPTMAIGPLDRLVVLMGATICLRAVMEGCELALALQTDRAMPTDVWLFTALRWLSGILGALVLTVMARKTLKIPNTQSATGILYVAVIATFLGELASLLLDAQRAYPAG